MPFLFHYNNRFALVDTSTRHGLFCQFFNANNVSRPFSIQAGPSESYSATISPDYKLHVLSMGNTYQIYYYSIENGRLLKKSLVANATENYILSSPFIYHQDHKLFLTYLSHQKDTPSYSLIYQDLDASIFTTLVTLNTEPKHFSHLVHEDCTYIFYMTHSGSHYGLNATLLTPNHVKHVLYIDSPVPILDYCVCLVEDQIHITYVAEAHGKYQLYYTNPKHNIRTLLFTSSQCPSPTIFSYLDFIWINIYCDSLHQVLLSIDNGLHFSLPTPTSLQNHLHRYAFTSLTPTSLMASELFASISSTVHLNIIYQLDFEHLHPDSHLPVELDLFIEGMRLSRKNLMEEVSYAETAQNFPDKKKKTSRLDSAKSAFMEQLNGWDIPPKV